MARNDIGKIFEKAKDVIQKNKLFFVEDVIAYLPISKPTFYDYFKVDSNEFNVLKELLEENKIEIKIGLRKKWFASQAPALQLALMKLICSDDERKKLSMQYTETVARVQISEYEDWTPEQLDAEIKRLESK